MDVQRDLFGGRKNEYELPLRADPAHCRSCGAAIVWITTDHGKAMPLSVATIEERDGFKYALPHFADCPQAKEWSHK